MSESDEPSPVFADAIDDQGDTSFIEERPIDESVIEEWPIDDSVVEEELIDFDSQGSVRQHGTGRGRGREPPRR